MKVRTAGILSKLRQEVAAYVLPLIPAFIRKRLVIDDYSWSFWELRTVAKLKGTERKAKVRLLIAPANYASQAVYWARASEMLPGVVARNLAFGYSIDGKTARADVVADPRIGRNSTVWGRRQRRAIRRSFTHLLIEAERSITPALWRGGVLEEAQYYREHGLKVAFVSHGSDVRLPSRHTQRNKFSPFTGNLEGLTEELEATTTQNINILRQSEAIKFVSTPDLLDYVEGGVWLPTLTDTSKWLSIPRSPQTWKRPVVLHVPSKSALKGTNHVSTALTQLHDEGTIEYRECADVPYFRMTELVASADIVVDQMTMGLYGVASVEAMLAGRIVLAEVGAATRARILQQTGYEVPIVECNPENLYSRLKEIAGNPKAFARLGAQGKRYALAVHSPRRAAKVLEEFLSS